MKNDGRDEGEGTRRNFLPHAGRQTEGTLNYKRVMTCNKR